jgi:hypothetical protein
MGETISRRAKRALEKTLKERLPIKNTGLVKEHPKMGCQHRSEQTIIHPGEAAHGDSATQVSFLVRGWWHK